MSLYIRAYIPPLCICREPVTHEVIATTPEGGTHAVQRCFPCARELLAQLQKVEHQSQQEREAHAFLPNNPHI